MKDTYLYEKFFIKEKIETPYENGKEYLLDLFCILDSFIQIALVMKEQEEEGAMGMKGIMLSERELSKAVFMNSIVNRGLGLADHIREDFYTMYEHIRKRLRLGEFENKIANLVSCLDLSSFEEFCLVLALSSEYSRNYETIYMYLQNNANENYPTKGLAISLYQILFDLSDASVDEFLKDQGNLGKYLLITKESDGRYSDFLFLEKNFVSHLLFEKELSMEHLDGAVFYKKEEPLPPLIIHHNIYHKIDKTWSAYKSIPEKPESLIIQLHGREGIGKHFLIRNLAKQHKSDVIFYDITSLIYLSKKEWMDRLYKLSAFTRLNEAIICLIITQISEEGNDSNIVRMILQSAEQELKYYFLISTEGSEGFLSKCNHAISLEVTMLSSSEKIVLWKDFSKGYELDRSVNVSLNGNKYILTAKGIKEVLSTAKLHSLSLGKERVNQADIIFGVKQRQQEQLGSYASLLTGKFTWKDLILEDNQKSLLQLICNQIQYRNVVGEHWGFFEKMPYGRGISALFYGAPGTGKTMAVQVIANTLGLDLYRIDLSQLVSKYIGETEKNISELFGKAKNINAMLFFDEADGLFAKRSEVRDSNDRNANNMTAHLLQKLEEYEGITILATNLVNNIDDAFKRRIKFMVRFAFPSSDVRLSLFQSILPDRAECQEELDFKYFADHFELSGSSIKDILVNAAYLAAGENTGMANRHIVEAIKLNYIKYGKLLTNEDFGYLAEG